MVAAQRPLTASGEGHVRLEGVSAGPRLQAISLALLPGERCALLGGNGAGKSTLLRLAAGLSSPDGGQVDVGGRIGYVPQDAGASLLPWFRVRKNIALGQRLGDHALERILAVVPTCAALLDRWPYQLSGGEQQLVVLARALANDPRVLLLDEPFSALDAAVRPLVRRRLRAWIDDHGATLLVATHDDDDVRTLADRVVRLQGQPARLHALERGA